MSTGEVAGVSPKEDSSLGRAFRSVVAVVGGYIVLAVVTAALNLLAAVALGVPVTMDMGTATERPPTLYSAVNLILSLPAAILGGYVTAVIARRAPVIHATVLGVLVLVLGAGYQLTQLVGRAEGSVTEPVWYLLLLPALGFVGALAGGFLRALRHSG